MSDTPDDPNTEMSGNAERVPAGPEAIEQAEQQALAAEQREPAEHYDDGRAQTPEA